MRTRNCDWCGAYLGLFWGGHDTREPEVCGRQECNRGMREGWREEMDDRQERACEDDFSRY
jgi:hypothetical protein